MHQREGGRTSRSLNNGGRRHQCPTREATARGTEPVGGSAHQRRRPAAAAEPPWKYDLACSLPGAARLPILSARTQGRRLRGRLFGRGPFFSAPGRDQGVPRRRGGSGGAVAASMPRAGHRGPVSDGRGRVLGDGEYVEGPSIGEALDGAVPADVLFRALRDLPAQSSAGSSTRKVSTKRK